MTKTGKVFIVCMVVVVLAGLVLYFGQDNIVLEENIIDNSDVLQNETENTYDVSLLSGKTEDFVSFSVAPNQEVGGVLPFKGSMKGAWFFEANILINILDANQNVLKNGYAMATTDWMTVDPVEFEGTIDLTGLPTGPAYIQIHNDNPSGEPQFDKHILIPIIIQ